MRNAKLWSVLLAAVLLCACIAGILFTGASASDSRIPTNPTTTYVVGEEGDGDTIRACLDKAAGETWAENTVLEIQFSGEDSSAYASPDAANGISGYTLFETATIFREDDTQLPIIIRGMDEDRAALIKTANNNYVATNDYFFTNLTMNGGDGTDIAIYAGSGELVFENCKFNNYATTYYYGDCFVTDAYEGWDDDKMAANSATIDGVDLVETGIVFGNGCTGLFATGTSGQRFSAVGNNGDATTNSVIYALRRAKANAKALTEAEIAAAQEAAPLATFKKGNLVTIEECVVKPWDTASYLKIDLGTTPSHTTSMPDIGMATARKGVSPVRDARLEMISGGCQYLSVEADSGTHETFVGDTSLIFRGGRSGRQTGTSGSYYSDVGIRVSNLAMFIGDLTLELHEDDPNYPTWTPWIQTSQSASSVVHGNYKFLMTGGTIGDGTHGNDGYWGAPVATGTIVNEVRGGKIWAFYGSRYANSYENTPVSTTLPGTNEVLTANVTVHNIISGGQFGDLVDGKCSSTKGFHGQGKSSVKLASACNEITGGEFYWFNAASSGTGTAPGDIYNFVSSTETTAPRFYTHFYGTRCTVTTPSVTNVFKGSPVFKNTAGEKMSIFGGCANGTVTKIDNYLGGLPEFDAFYGGVSGTKSGKGIAVDITNTIALNMTDSTLPNYVWGGNGYYQITGVDGATSTTGHSDSAVTGSITCNVYSGHFGTFRAESASGKMDVCPMTVNVYGGKWTSDYMPANRNYYRGQNTSETPVVVTNNIYGGEFNRAYMGGQNPNDREFVNNVYGGTFNNNYYGGGGIWAKKVTNNIYGGTFMESYYGVGGGYSTSSKSYYGTGCEAVVNNIYGGTFSDSHEYMGTYSNPSSSTRTVSGEQVVISNICEEQTIENNFYGGDFGKNWLYCGHRNGTTGTITNNFYSGEQNPVRDPENELYEYFDAEGNTTKASGTYFHDQIVGGGGYSEANLSTNRAESITNNIYGGAFTKNSGAYTDITIRCGMRWGIVGDVTNTFISGSFYRVFGGCDYGYVSGKITNTYGEELAEGETAPTLAFAEYVYGGGYDQTPDRGKSNGAQLPALLFSDRIAAAKQAQADGATLTATQQSWLDVVAEFGEDFTNGAKEIENNIYYGSFHQFFGGSYGSVATATEAVSKIDTITNNVYGGIFNVLDDGDSYGFIGGCFRNALLDTITNNIKGGVFNSNYYGGTIGIGTVVDCNAIINNIDYAEGCATANRQFYLGNGGPTYNGTVTSVINDFKANKTYIYAGSSNTHNQPEGVEYGISTTINGGEFSGFWGLGGGTHCLYTGNIKTVVNGGTFNGYASNMPNAFMGGPRNGQITGNIVTEINDGTFTADFVGGTIWGSQSAAHDTIYGDITTTIKGGSFENIYPLTRYSAEDLKATGTVTLNVEQTAGVALNFTGKATVTNFKSNGEEIKIGANTNLVIENLEGKLNLNQTEGWQAHDYLSLPAGSVYEITEEDGIYGIYTEDATILVKGVGFGVSGVTIRLEDKLGLRVLFDPNYTDSFADAFTVKVTLDGKVLASGTYADLEMYQGYYSFIVSGIGLKDFDTSFKISGNVIYEKELTMIGLVETAKTVFVGEWAEVLGAIENLHKVYNLGEANTLTAEAVADTEKATAGAANDKVSSASVSLAMSDVVAVVVDAELAEVPANFVVKVNGTVIESGYTVTAGEETATVKITLPVMARFMEDVISVELSSDTGVYFTYDFSVASLAYKLSNDAENPNAANASALLSYIQQAVDCVA